MDKFNNLNNLQIEYEETKDNKYLTFFIENQIYGISIADVVQITEMQEITKIPEFPHYAIGVINLRGIIVPIIDVRLRLKKERADYDERTCIIVTNIEDLYIGFIVDSVNEVINIYSDNISNAPQIGNDYVSTYITGVAKLHSNMVLLIDFKKILNEKEIESINLTKDELEGVSQKEIINTNKENIQEIHEVIPWLIFKLNGNLYTVNSKYITSIVIKPDIVTFVPNVSEHIDGLIHLRGNVIPLINLKILLNIAEIETYSVDESNEYKKMIVVFERDNSFMGLIVDKVLSVENISAYEETEEIKKMCISGFVRGVAKGHKSDDVLLVLDEEKIMSNA